MRAFRFVNCPASHVISFLVAGLRLASAPSARVRTRTHVDTSLATDGRAAHTYPWTTCSAPARLSSRLHEAHEHGVMLFNTWLRRWSRYGALGERRFFRAWDDWVPELEARWEIL